MTSAGGQSIAPGVSQLHNSRHMLALVCGLGMGVCSSLFHCMNTFAALSGEASFGLPEAMEVNFFLIFFQISCVSWIMHIGGSNGCFSGQFPPGNIVLFFSASLLRGHHFGYPPPAPRCLDDYGRLQRLVNLGGLNKIAGVAFVPPNSLLCVLPASLLRTHHTPPHVCIGKQSFDFL